MAGLSVRRRFAAPPERVFDAWLDPALAKRFLFATPGGEMIRADVDARVAGRFNFTDRRPAMGDVEHVGEYLEIERPHRLRFTFAVPKYDPRYTTVAVDIASLPEGGCELTLTHEGVPEAWRDQTKQGWGMILDALAQTLGG
jgi:uncharacterized protein YndB with AHSA1/START domain